MTENTDRVEKRLQRIKQIYERIDEICNSLPDSIPKDKKKWIKDTILGDADLKELMDGIDNNRPPRFFLIGRTGVGKSSLINALCGSYVASVGDTRSCTNTVNTHHCKCEGRVLMEVLDTRGIAESEPLNQEISAEDMILKQINEFSPDVAILVLNCTHRDDIVSDIEFLKKASHSFRENNGVDLPILVVLNKADEIAPARIKESANYSKVKLDNINDVVQYYKEIIIKHDLHPKQIVAVSSLLEWMTEDGKEVSTKEIEKMTSEEIDSLKISFDGRYNIDELYDFLEDAIQDYAAKMGLRMATRLSNIVDRIARHLTKVFSAIAATIAAVPIPISDIFPLIVIQAVLVQLIAALSGQDLSIEAAKDFAIGLGGISGVGFALRFTAQQVTKLLNLFAPGVGSAASAGIAALGTAGMGKAARLYYIQGRTLEEAKKTYKESQKKGTTHLEM